MMRRKQVFTSQSVDSFQSVRLNRIDRYLNYESNSEGLLNDTNYGNVNRRTSKSESNYENDSVYYWPNCDASIWMRSCEQEVIMPINGKIVGEIPSWLNGTLLRNGPGSLKVGNYRFDHLFDSSALLHKFHIGEGNVTYQRRFVQTDVYKRNQQAQRIVLTEFGTRAIPDPCQTIFNRIAAIFNPAENTSDNSMISVYPVNDEFYTFAEYPVIHRVDPETLETKKKINISKHVGIVNHTSHPHVMSNGTVFNVGMGISSKGPTYNVVQFPRNNRGSQQSTFEQAKIVASIPARWLLNPSYMHTFGITENYYVIVEQPLAVSITTMIKSHLKNDPLCSCLKWHDNENTLIHVISRKTGKLFKTFRSETFFFLHIINQFETQDKNYIVIDICCYRDAKMINCMYVEEMKNMHNNPDYSKLFRGRPLRFILPIGELNCQLSPQENLIKINNVHGNAATKTTNCFHKIENNKTILGTRASAYRLKNDIIFVQPELICDLGCETPRFNYDNYLGKEYRYFYAISSDVDLDNPGTLIKVDTVEKTKLTWNEDGLYPSEPIFVLRPGATDEDDGVILSAAIYGKSNETDISLLIIDAKTMTEIGRSTFSTPGPVPKCLHGWFAFDKNKN